MLISAEKDSSEMQLDKNVSHIKDNKRYRGGDDY